MLLDIKNLHVRHGAVSALRDVNLSVKEGEFTTFVGANGAGKSTLLRTISGLHQPQIGSIHFDGQAIAASPPNKILRAGIAHVPEGRRVFKDLSTEENLRLGAFTRDDNVEIENDLEQVYQYFPRLLERKHQLARTMSGGEQQMLAIGRALMAKPRLLLLDEPSLGLAPVIIDNIARIMREINAAGVTIVLVEQNADMALRLADTGHVLETGEITLSAPAKELANNEHVKRAYLGV